MDWVGLAIKCDELEKTIDDKFEIKCSRLENGRFMEYEKYYEYLLKTIKDEEAALALLTDEEKEKKYNHLVHLSKFPESIEAEVVVKLMNQMFTGCDDGEIFIDGYNVKGADKIYKSFREAVKKVDKILEDYEKKVLL
jgi:hypothetical protein